MYTDAAIKSIATARRRSGISTLFLILPAFLLDRRLFILLFIVISSRNFFLKVCQRPADILIHLLFYCLQGRKLPDPPKKNVKLNRHLSSIKIQCLRPVGTFPPSSSDRRPPMVSSLHW